jgi:predicted aspartyl protease
MATSFAYNDFYFPPAPVADVIIRANSEVMAIALLDSGADGSVIPYPLLSTIGAKFVRTHRMTGITGASTMVDLYMVQVQIGDFTLRGVKAVASRTGNEVILGRDVLNHLIITLDGIAGITEIS